MGSKAPTQPPSDERPGAIPPPPPPRKSGNTASANVKKAERAVANLKDRPPTIGVSIPFFCGAVKLLAKHYGEKLCGDDMEKFRAALAEAELRYKEMPSAN